MLKPIALLAITGVLVASLGVAAAQEAQPPEVAKLDLSACAELEGAERGDCIASLALERAGDLVGNATAQAALELVAGCRELEEAAFGECVSTAARALGETAATVGVALGAQGLALDCATEEGQAFGQCVSAKAQDLAAAAKAKGLERRPSTLPGGPSALPSGLPAGGGRP